MLFHNEKQLDSLLSKNFYRSISTTLFCESDKWVRYPISPIFSQILPTQKQNAFHVSSDITFIANSTEHYNFVCPYSLIMASHSLRFSLAQFVQLLRQIE